MNTCDELPTRLPPAAPAAGPRAPRGRGVRRLVLAAAVAVLLVGWAVMPWWEWSFIDDGQLLGVLDDAIARHGPVGGVAYAAAAAYRFDVEWGLFRPAYWGYVATFYLLPPGPAHAVRLAMFGVALAGPLVVVIRRYQPGQRAVPATWASVAMLANPSLYFGLWYPSLQELSGLSLVGAGLCTRRPWLRLGCWLLAAWFKTPLAWLLVAQGVVDLWQGQRRRGAVTAGLGVVTIALATGFARGGEYSGGLSFTVDRFAASAAALAGPLGALVVVLLVGAMGLGARFRLGDPLALVMLGGGAGYLANLMPWRTDVHYAAPYVYLLGLGVLLSVHQFDESRRRRPALALAAVVVAGLLFVFPTVRAGVRVSMTTSGLRDCVAALPANSVVGYNRAEAWIRLEQIVRRHDPGWRGRLARVGPGEAVGWRDDETLPLDYYIHEAGRGDPAAVLRAGPVVCRTPLAIVHRVTAAPSGA